MNGLADDGSAPAKQDRAMALCRTPAGGHSGHMYAATNPVSLALHLTLRESAERPYSAVEISRPARSLPV
jgi:hypothetical protein